MEARISTQTDGSVLVFDLQCATNWVSTVGGDFVQKQNTRLPNLLLYSSMLRNSDNFSGANFELSLCLLRSRFFLLERSAANFGFDVVKDSSHVF